MGWVHNSHGYQVISSFAFPLMRAYFPRMALHPWESACLAAFLETDSTRILSRINVARDLMTRRLDGPDPISTFERREIENALKGLYLLEMERTAKGLV